VNASLGQALLLIGSAKKLHTSTSESLGMYLLDRLSERGFGTESLFLHQCFRTGEANDALHAAIERADLIVFAFPMYIDCLPYHVIKTFEQIAERRNTAGAPKRQRFLAISNCGFPEAHQMDTVMAICRQFARETDLEWAGGLALGGGESLGGKPLAEIGGMARHVVKALDLTAGALAMGNAAPDEAIALMAKPLVPPWLFRLVGGIGWRLRARELGARKRLHDRPFEMPATLPSSGRRVR